VIHDCPVYPDPAPKPHASAAEVAAARQDPKLANVLYHDWEADRYDAKWSISFDRRCTDYATGRFRAAAGSGGWPYGHALELGCGTGFFLLNLIQGGVIAKGAVTDLSPGMVRAALRNATELGMDIEGRVADAERIPYDGDTFDLVVGHAVLHHIPDVGAALHEVLRVLRPGGRFVFAGEPTRIGDRYARALSRLTWRTTTAVARLPMLRGWRRPQAELDESSRAAALEAVVDQHTFDPGALADLARSAGAADVRVVTEELTAALLGWSVRTVEAALRPERLGWRWAMTAYRSWLTLFALDCRVLSRVLPPGWFYNALLTGTKPVVGPHD
jgi:ubiquinone/menaquinone biosynthesis C-methylase UbiE